ncbi:hypothetical protein [Paraburkholderia xenovorans]
MNKYAALVMTAVVGMLLYDRICWANLDAASIAAWVQAVGSIIAIVIAVAVPLVQQKRERELRAQTEKEIASRQSLIFVSIAARVERAVQRAIADFTQGVGNDRMDTGELDELLTRLADAQQTAHGRAAQQLVFQMHELARGVREQVTTHRFERNDYWAGEFRIWQNNARGAISKAMAMPVN